jgi:hypothetical protein
MKMNDFGFRDLNEIEVIQTELCELNDSEMIQTDGGGWLGAGLEYIRCFIYGMCESWSNGVDAIGGPAYYSPLR